MIVIDEHGVRFTYTDRDGWQGGTLKQRSGLTLWAHRRRIPAQHPHPEQALAELALQVLLDGTIMYIDPPPEVIDDGRVY